MMPHIKLDELPDYPKWLALYERKKHLTIDGIISAAIKEWGGTRSTWQGRFNNIRNNYNRKNIRELAREEKDKLFINSMGRDYPYIQPHKLYSKKIDPCKIVCISDPHVPYQKQSISDDILSKHHDAAHIHINGDSADFYSKTHFRKTGHEDFSYELKKLFDYFEWLSTHWKRVTVLLGNHDNRAEKKISDELDSDMLWMVEMNLIEYVSSFFDNIEVVGESVKDENGSFSLKFLWQYGDILFTHIERSQKQSSSLLSNIEDSLYKWASTFGLNGFRWIVQGHNHRFDLSYNGAHFLALVPMAANLTGTGLQYVLQPSMRGVPPVTGYFVFFQKDGITDFNQSRVYLL